MSRSSFSRRSVRRPNADHDCAANALGIHLSPPATQCVPPSMSIPQTPAVDTRYLPLRPTISGPVGNQPDFAFSDRSPPAPRIPIQPLPSLPLPLPPQPLFRLHETLTDVTFHWDVRLSPAPTELTEGALTLPAFDSTPALKSIPKLKSIRLHFRPVEGAPAMDYSCDVAVPTPAPTDKSPEPAYTYLTIGHVFRGIHDAVYAALKPTALPRGDPLRLLAEWAFCRRTGRRFIPHVDVLRNVDLHMAAACGCSQQVGGGLFLHKIVVEQAEGAFPVFRVVLRDYRPFA